MNILIIRTDKPEAEIGVFADNRQLAYRTWLAHRQLAETIHQTIQAVLKEADMQLEGIGGIVLYKGPGSFTGLRIGASVANALAESLGCSIVAVTGDDWREAGLGRLARGEDDGLALPEYGAPPHITPPKH